MARKSLLGKGIFHPVAASSWPEFMIGSVLAGLLLGIGWAIGSNIVNHFAPAPLRADPSPTGHPAHHPDI